MTLPVDVRIGTCEQTSNISDHGVEIENQTEKSNIK